MGDAKVLPELTTEAVVQNYAKELEEVNNKWWKRIAKFALKNAHHIARFFAEDDESVANFALNNAPHLAKFLSEDFEKAGIKVGTDAAWWRSVAKFALNNAHHLAKFL